SITLICFLVGPHRNWLQVFIKEKQARSVILHREQRPRSLGLVTENQRWMPFARQGQTSARLLHRIQEVDLRPVVFCAGNPDPERSSVVTELKAGPAFLVCPQYDAPDTIAIKLNEAGSPWFWPEP